MNKTRSKATRHWSAQLEAMGACADAVAFAREHRTFRAAWAACARADWMLWYIGKAVPDTAEHRERITCAAIRIVQTISQRQAIPQWEAWAGKYLSGEDRSVQGAAWAEAEVGAAATAGAEAAEAARAAARAAGAQLVRDAYPIPPKAIR